MKRKFVVILFAFIVIAVLTGTTLAQVNGPELIQLKMKINHELAGEFDEDLFIKGNEDRFNLDLSTNSPTPSQFVKINATKTPVHDLEHTYLFEGKGIICLDSGTYPFSFNDYIYSAQLENGDLIYFGAVNGEIRSREKTDKMVLALRYTRNLENQEIIATVGDLTSPNGVAAIPFGTPFLTQDIINLMMNTGKE